VTLQEPSGAGVVAGPGGCCAAAPAVRKNIDAVITIITVDHRLVVVMILLQ
jgi:hypothetical protein